MRMIDYFWCAARMGLFIGVGMSVTVVLAISQERPTREGFMFSYVDADSDGALSPGEFTTVLYPTATRRRSGDAASETVMAAFRRADMNGDGRVDRPEFGGWLANRN